LATGHVDSEWNNYIV